MPPLKDMPYALQNFTRPEAGNVDDRVVDDVRKPSRRVCRDADPPRRWNPRPELLDPVLTEDVQADDPSLGEIQEFARAQERPGAREVKQERVPEIA